MQCSLLNYALKTKLLLPMQFSKIINFTCLLVDFLKIPLLLTMEKYLVNVSAYAM
jgi:hypothetical protein